MTLPLDPELRKQLQKAVADARGVGEEGARAALRGLAVDAARPHPSMAGGDRALRVRLRAHGRQLGDRRSANGGTQEIDRLAHEVAYEHWHRMLFARFLAENGLLVEPESGVAVTLAECAELAREGMGADGWAVAEGFASALLPRIFRPGDPALQVRLAPEHRRGMERLVSGLPTAVFGASDSLGWTYQFWQEEEKKRVNASGSKIGERELPAVTQLFTENYMVRFLFHNTVGAWRAGRVLAERPDLAENARSEAELAGACRIEPKSGLSGYDFEYLRFVREPSPGNGAPDAVEAPSTASADAPGPGGATARSPAGAAALSPGGAAASRPGEKPEDAAAAGPPAGRWRPAAGAYPKWPRSTAALRVLDPCCGSGHFLVEGLELLARLRMEEEGLGVEAAVCAVLRDNLFGLELDPRCAQIAAFHVAFAAWRLAGRVFELPPLQVAAVGVAPRATREDWLELAQGDLRLEGALAELYGLFEKAPVLGSLIEPRSVRADLLSVDYEDAERLLAVALAREDGSAEDSAGDSDAEAEADARERAVAAQGISRAAKLLALEYDLVITNVPYLARGKQGAALQAFGVGQRPDAKADLATLFVSRALNWLGGAGAQAVVAPQNWLFLTSYRKLRERLLGERTWRFVARLGPGAFETISGEVVNVAMAVLSAERPDEDWRMAGIDVSAPRGEKPIPAREKAALLRASAAPRPDERWLDGISGGWSARPADPVGARPDGGRGLGRPPSLSGAGGEVCHESRLGTGASDEGERSVADAEREGPGVLSGGRPTVGESAASEGAPASACDLRDADHPRHAATSAPGDVAGVPATGTSSPDVPPKGAATTAPVITSLQGDQRLNPAACVLLRPLSGQALLREVGYGHQGIATADYAHWGRKFWESPERGIDWEFQQSTVKQTVEMGGREHVVHWEQGQGQLQRSESVRIQGGGAWGRDGIAVSQMGPLPVTRYTGEYFDNNVAVLTVTDAEDVPAVWCFCSSPGYGPAIRQFDQKLNVTNANLVNAPFDLDHWRKVAAEKYPNGLPEPYTDDPTQWLFHGHPCGSVVWDEESKWTAHGPLRTDASVLHVAVARLLGYRWPAELDPDMRLSEASRDWVERCLDLDEHADADGIVCLHPAAGERPAADRVRDLLRAAYGEEWSAETESELLRAAAFDAGLKKAVSLEDWLRDRFFAAHCKLFHNRPFVWHVWDGRRDGFHALVNCHRLCGPEGQGRRTLEALTFRHLGEWISRQRSGQEREVPGADARLAAALDLQQQLERILEGEPPYDLFIRWRPLHEQPIGWAPHLDDGVRLNVRPFMRAELVSGGRKGAGILRVKPNIKWNKDLGKESESLRPREDFPWFWSCPGQGTEADRTDYAAAPDAAYDGHRWNDLHYTRAAKEAARAAAAGDGQG